MRQAIRTAWAAARLAAVAAVCMAGLSTCVTGEERDYVKYDAAADKFQMLTVLTNLHAKEQDDLDYLAGLYKNRDHWIMPAIPGGMDVTPLLGASLIRTGNHQWAMVNVFTSRPDKVDSTPTTVDLDQVKITPGEFFGDGKSIGYYQAIEVPGVAIDKALVEVSQALLGDGLQQTVQGAIDGRSSGSSKKVSWADMKERVLKTVTLDKPADAAASQPADSTDISLAMEDKSLSDLLAAAKGKTIAITRDKRVIKVTFPLTAADAAGAADLEKAVVAKATQAASVKETDENREQLEQVRALATLGKVAKVDAGTSGLTISLDLVDFAQATASMPTELIDMNDQGKDSPKKPDLDLAAYLKDQKIVVDSGLTADAVVKAFDAGTLKGHPSEKPVTPGEGIAKPGAGGGQ